ncbi:glycoside hydrolase family 32 protein [Pontibacillus salicampi]|uniref:Sucrose-6-phosphate hydrolase n=1 Tax=Pontibacillus salicampi TaxID=1449801 RepID=A0ABV6LMC9_9BACI
MSTRDEQLRKDAQEAVEKHKELVQKDPYRLNYHIMPPVGLLNDPNGFIQWKGIYHMFYQWMPFHTGHGAKFWGHYTSNDLVHWQEERTALTPSEWYEKNGCYSGSAIAHNDQLYLFYTGNVKDEKGERESYQVMATSKDGIHFEKQGVVVQLPEGYTAHFRDPKVWQQNGKWYMVVGTQNHQQQGRVAILQSDNLTDWKHLGDVTGAHTKQLDAFGYMWECPDLFHLDGKEVLVVSPQGLQKEGDKYENVYQSGYFVGDVDYSTGEMQHGAFHELDQGFEFYAPQTTEDEHGRRILVGWMGVPDQNEEAHPTVQYKWIHTLTLPRVLTLKEEKLYQNPVEELSSLRGKETIHQQVRIQTQEISLQDVEGDSMELYVQLHSVEADVVEIQFRNHARLIYRPSTGKLTLERKSFVDYQTESRSCTLQNLSTLRIFMDTSSLEIFVNNGEEVFTSRMYPYEENNSVIFGTNGTVLMDVHKWDMGKM